ncbi:hypothetical protein SAMN05216388_102625 [Halorientalis persicus]|uniref:Uncharacterized protein n=1 Tax=Halorientalis persicus TaxID=1367881 RepID=A0A1H8U8K5_9EURY|nr:hypothetical protein [Halorientalis persicus]SEO99539.1 hypothetical protein SAMN05216388_102625 [Halorientalis persicus]
MAFRYGCVSALTAIDAGTEDEVTVSHPPSSIAPGDHLFHRTVTDTRKRQLETGQTTSCLREVRAEYRRHVVDTVAYDGSNTTIRFEHRLPETESMIKDLHGPGHEWRTSPPPEMPDFPRSAAECGDEPDWIFSRWEPPRTNVPTAPAAKALDFHHLEGEGALRTVNQFLAGGPDGRVDHRLLGVDGFRHAFGAVYDGHLISVAVLEHGHNREIADYNQTRYLTRLANHPNRPPNTSSWMLGRIRGWLRHNTEISRLIALAGVDGNRGICYAGAGFEHTKTLSLDSGETSVDENWTKRRWEASI